MRRLGVFSLLFIVLILAPIGLNQYYNFLLKPKSLGESYQIFVVKPGQSVASIAKNLEEAGLVKSNLAFRLLVAQMGIAKNIQAGDFRLSPHLNSRQIAQELTHGAIDVWITLPEGLRIEEIGERIEAKLKSTDNETYQFDRQEFIELAQEGYMFPDTYLVARDTGAKDIVKRLRTTFDEKVDKRILEKGAKNNLTEQQVIILASLVEREAKKSEERTIIAGILINRIRAGVALQVDATIQYAKGWDSTKNTWWAPVTREDYRDTRSPYNTYLVLGLPPRPISSPGIESIRAAAEPADTEYLYYLHDREGKIHYAKTIEEHQKNIQEFL